MPKEHPRRTDPLKDQAYFLEKTLKSRDPATRSHALARVRRALPPFTGLSDDEVLARVRLNDLLTTVTREQTGDPSWTSHTRSAGPDPVYAGVDDDALDARDTEWEIRTPGVDADKTWEDGTAEAATLREATLRVFPDHAGYGLTLHQAAAILQDLGLLRATWSGHSEATDPETRTSTPPSRAEEIRDEYEPRALALLEDLRSRLVATGIACEEPARWETDDLKWGMVARSSPSHGDPRQVGIELELAERRIHEDEDAPEEVSFRIEAVDDESRTAYLVSPSNYSPDTWVDAHDPEEVERRWSELVSIHDPMFAVRQIVERLSDAGRPGRR